MPHGILQPGQKVRFKLKDIHLPSVKDVLHRMTPETELQGCISLLSDEGAAKSAYAVVEVKGILMPVIVPAGRIRPAAPRDEAMVA